MAYTDILYEKKGGVAWITINRPEVRNAFRTTTVAGLTDAFVDARWDATIGVVVLTGAGDKAFCSGGDQKERGQGGYAPGERPMDVEALHSAIRHIPKPVIAMVNGFAVGGGHVLHVLCDLSIAAESAIFGQSGPRVGSVDAGHRALGPVRAARGRRGRGPRHRLSGASRRREEGARDLVSLPPVFGRGRARDGTRQQGGPAQGPSRRGGEVVRGAARQESHSAGAREAVVQHRLRGESRRGAVRAHRAGSLLPDRRGDGRPQRVRGEAARRLQEIPKVTKGALDAPWCRHADTPLVRGRRRLLTTFQ